MYKVNEDESFGKERMSPAGRNVSFPPRTNAGSWQPAAKKNFPKSRRICYDSAGITGTLVI